MRRKDVVLVALTVLAACGERPRFATELEVENGKSRVALASVQVGGLTVGVVP